MSDSDHAPPDLSDSACLDSAPHLREPLPPFRVPPRLLVGLLAALFVSEKAVMFLLPALLSLLPPVPAWVVNCLDAGLLALIMLPVSYLLMFRAMSRQIAALDRERTSAWEKHERVRGQEALYRTLFERAPLSVLLIDPVGTLPVEFNDMACRQLGYSREEFARLGIADYEAAESPAETRTHIDKVLREGRDEFRTLHRAKGGDIRDILVTARTIELSGRTLIQCVFRDITEIEKSVKRFRDLASIIETTSEGIVITGTDGIVKYVNSSWEKMTGWASLEVVGKLTPRILKSGRNDPALYERLWRTITQGQGFRCEMNNRRKDGTLYEVEIIITPLKDAAGRITGYSGIERDITERLRLQAQFLQAQKMEAVGMLAGGVAHDFNNILTAIAGYSEFLLQDLAPGDPKRLDVEEIRKAGERAAGLTRQLLAFSRRQVLQPRLLDINAVLRELGKMLHRLIGEDVELVFDLADHLGTVKADPGQIEQIVMNLVLNSRDALPKGGRITIETQDVELGPSYCAAHPEVAPGPYVLLAVSDDGCGMDQATLSHIFEPFFTTKERGKGTGLGLATVYGIVKQSGGSVFVYSEPGHGTAFKVYLPLLRDSPQPLKPRPQAGPAVGTETVLLVEDEELVRDFAKRALRQSGYTVFEAKDPEEALALCVKEGASIRLLLTDMVLPQMHGNELAELVRAVIPGVKVVFMSGYTDKDVVGRESISSEAAFLQKPMTIDALTRKVREALDGPSRK